MPLRNAGSYAPRRLVADAIPSVRPWLNPLAHGWPGVLTLGALVYVLVYLVAFVVHPAGERGVQVLSDFGEIPVEALGLTLALTVVGREPRRTARIAWGLFAIAQASNLVGNALYGGYDLAGEIPFPSAADAFYLAFYPLMLTGLLVLPTASGRRELFAWRVWSNVGIVMLGGGMALIHFVLLPTIAQLGNDPFATLISLAYPAGDLALVAALATISNRRPFQGDRAAVALFALAVAAWFFADLTFAIASADGSYAPGGFADVLWLASDVSLLLAAQASLAGLPERDRETPGETLAIGRAGSYLMLALGLVTLVAAAFGAHAEIALLAVLAVVLTALVVARQVVDENERRRVEATLLAEHAAAAERAARQARLDALTGLPNRTRLHELLRAEIEASRLTARPVTLAFVDLDFFKSVNDTFGHAMGDELLVEVGRRLSGSTRESDTVARLGGDEFAIVMPSTPTERALEVAHRARAALERPIMLAGTEIAVGGSFGLATYPDSGAIDGDGLMRRADTAMYRAKRSRLGPSAYEAAFEEHGLDGSALVKLRSAIEGNGLVLAFQPIRDGASGAIVGSEALVRWNHPSRGILPPAEFLPLATHAGLMRALDARVLELACAQAAAWRREGIGGIVSVNVSRDSLEDATFSQRLSATLERHDIPGSSIVLEITEDGLLENAERGHAFVEAARSLGVRTAIDDFGTGFSSLGRLRDLPVDYLKVDRSFVTGAPGEPQNAAIVEAVVELAHRLGKRVVAEGVEDESTLAYLDELGVDFAQGFFIGRPAPPGDVSPRLPVDRRSGSDPVATRLDYRPAVS